MKNLRLPFNADFSDPALVSTSETVGMLTISPNAATVIMLSVPVTVPPFRQVVGCPSLSFTYQGEGTSRAVFARLVETGTGNVLGDGVHEPIHGRDHGLCDHGQPVVPWPAHVASGLGRRTAFSAFADHGGDAMILSFRPASALCTAGSISNGIVRTLPSARAMDTPP